MIVETIHVYMYNGNFPHFSSICLQQHLYLCFETDWIFYYFYDGAASQYKLQKCHQFGLHHDDIGLDAEMTKMLVMVFCNLQAVTTGHILTPVDLLYQWSLVCSTQKGCENIFSEM